MGRAERHLGGDATERAEGDFVGLRDRGCSIPQAGNAARLHGIRDDGATSNEASLVCHFGPSGQLMGISTPQHFEQTLCESITYCRQRIDNGHFVPSAHRSVVVIYDHR
jgi:hypothetical protein